MDRSIQVGDWVCFQQLGTPTYGLVLYSLPRGTDPKDAKLMTTCGECIAGDVLEVRPAREEAGS